MPLFPSGPVLQTPTDTIEGVPLYGYGNSYLGVSTQITMRRYFERLAGRTKAGSALNRGVNGALAHDVTQYAYSLFNLTGPSGSVAGTWNPSTLPGGIVICECVRNDAGWDGLSPAKARAGFTNSLTALLRLLRAQALYHDNDNGTRTVNDGVTNGTTTLTSATAAFSAATDLGKTLTVAGFPTDGSLYIQSVTNGTTVVMNQALAAGAALAVVIGTATHVYAGTWTTPSNAGYARGAAHQSTVNGSTVTITTPVGTDFDIVLFSVDSAALGAAGATFTTSIDGGSAVAGTTNDQVYCGKTLTSSVSMMTVGFHGLANTAHTIVLTHTGAGGTFLFFNGLLQQSPSPPTIIVPKTASLPAAGYAAYTAAGASAAIDLIYDGLIDTALAGFATPTRSVISFDPKAAGWTTAMIASTDAQQIHPDDTGMALYADGIMAILNSLPPRLGLIVI